MSSKINVKEVKRIYKGALNYLSIYKEEVNNLNVFPVPDGDTGTNMYLTFQSSIKSIEDSNPKTITELGEVASKGALLGARGNSGVIFSQILRGFSLGMAGENQIDGRVLVNCFKEGSEVAYKAVKKPVKGTILTVIDGLYKGAKQGYKKGNDFFTVLEESLREGQIVLDTTPDLLPVLREAGVVDAGGFGLLKIVEGIYKTAIGDNIVLETKAQVFESPIIDENYKSLDEIKYTYCTEFIILNPKDSNKEIRSELDSPEKGDSLVTIVADGIAKIHIHTNKPGQVLEYALSLGEVINIKIDNMKEQFKNKNKKLEKKQTKLKEYGFVMVVPGIGLGEIAKSMGVDAILDGGQTMNPSTHDIQDAIDTVCAKVIYVFPNNKNIVLSAEQTIELNKEKKIVVIPTLNIQQGFAAILAFNEELKPRENLKLMKDSYKELKTGAITYAIRSTTINGLKIKKDEILVLGENKIIGSAKTIEEGVFQYLEKNIDGHELITLYYGDMIKEDKAGKIKEEIEEKYENVEVSLYAGKQPVYFYFISLE